MEKCPTCGAEAPCPTCGDTGDLSHLGPLQEEIQHGERVRWALHSWRIRLQESGKTVAAERVSELIRMGEDLIDALRETGVH
jgi:hypothetical protein